MTAKIKWRGGYTNNPNTHKRNYSIKFHDENGEKVNQQLLDMRSDNHWILSAQNTEHSRLRNQVATELWRDINAKPYYSEKEPKAQLCVNARLVEVYLNGEYRGIYQLSEAMDRKQMKLKKYDEEKGQIRGLLWKGNAESDFVKMFTPFPRINNYTDSWYNYELEYPDLDDVCPTDWSTLDAAIRFVATSDDSTFIAQLDDYFDVPVLVDYYVFCNVAMAFDNIAKNLILGCYNQVKSPKITLGLWDADCTFGGFYDPWQQHTHLAGPEVDFNANWNISNLFQRLNDNEPFRTKIHDRYYELRKMVFDPDSLKQRFSTYFDLLRQTRAAARDSAKWSGDSDVGGKILDFDSEEQFILNWIDRRIAYLDEYFKTYEPTMKGDVNHDGKVDASDINCIVSVITGDELPRKFAPRTDVNRDKQINTADISSIADIIRNSSSSAPSKTK